MTTHAAAISRRRSARQQRDDGSQHEPGTEPPRGVAGGTEAAENEVPDIVADRRGGRVEHSGLAQQAARLPEQFERPRNQEQSRQQQHNGQLTDGHPAAGRGQPQHRHEPRPGRRHPRHRAEGDHHGEQQPGDKRAAPGAVAGRREHRDQRADQPGQQDRRGDGAEAPGANGSSDDRQQAVRDGNPDARSQWPHQQCRRDERAPRAQRHGHQHQQVDHEPGLARARRWPPRPAQRRTATCRRSSPARPGATPRGRGTTTPWRRRGPRSGRHRATIRHPKAPAWRRMPAPRGPR